MDFVILFLSLVAVGWIFSRKQTSSIFEVIVGGIAAFLAVAAIIAVIEALGGM